MRRKNRKVSRVVRAVAVLIYACLCWQRAIAHDFHGVDAEHATLIAQLRTDLTYPDDFDSVTVSSNNGNLHDVFSWSESWTPTPGQDLVAGVRVLERGEFHNGELNFVMSLMNGSDLVLSRPVRVTLSEGVITVVTVLMSKETPVLNWPTPLASIAYGTPLSAIQLNASAKRHDDSSLPGSYAYTPMAGNVLPAGIHTLSVTFTPSNTALYRSVTTSVSLTVIKASLIIDPHDKVRPPGTANPTFTARYLGLVNGDTPGSLDVLVSITTPATVASAAGTYPITASGASDANYSIAYFSGTLTITEKEIPLLFWAAPPSLTYGTPLGSPQLSVFATGGVLGGFVFDPPSGSILGAGAHSITATFTPDNQTRYETVSMSNDITVDPAPLTVRARNDTRIVGEKNPAFTAKYIGFVNGDTAGDLDVAPTFSTSADPSSPPGLYAISVIGVSDVNYAVTHVDGVLTVEDQPVLGIENTDGGIRITWKVQNGFSLFFSTDFEKWGPVEDIVFENEDALYAIPLNELDSFPSTMVLQLRRN